MNTNDRPTAISRRDFLKTSAGAAGALATAPLLGKSVSLLPSDKNHKPNFLFLNLDQLSCEAIHHHGCAAVKTPNLDCIGQRSVSFTQSYSANPVCCPARSAWFTGRYTPETGVMNNGLPLVKGMPDLGQWLRRGGYQAFYTGKWHIPARQVSNSFTVLGPDPRNTASLGDIVTTRSVEGFLRNYRQNDPFFLSVGLLNPHDICSFLLQNSMYRGAMPYPELVEELPPLPPNFRCDMKEPREIVQRKEKYFGDHGDESGMGLWKDDYWRYYAWAYYHYITMVDGQVGLILDTLEQSPFAENTVLILSADHGEGHGRHQMILKSFLYDEAARVPFMISWPGHLPENVIDNTRLVSGVDLFPTVCDYAGIETPPNMRGYSLRPVAEGNASTWRDFVISHTGLNGRMIRTNQYKLITYKDDPVAQLFNMKNDPWETKNLAEETALASVVEEHRKTLDDYEATFEVAPLPKKAATSAANDE
ncbi:MAG: sulfatase-like hydrolase/transferase [Candidatus Sumerlaeota bacterium]|nr:sulfatase-like hydrolase/transferase [Candidatus Sumerlaeota bacterium]